MRLAIIPSNQDRNVSPFAQFKDYNEKGGMDYLANLIGEACKPILKDNVHIFTGPRESMDTYPLQGLKQQLESARAWFSQSNDPMKLALSIHTNSIGVGNKDRICAIYGGAKYKGSYILARNVADSVAAIYHLPVQELDYSGYLFYTMFPPEVSSALVEIGSHDVESSMQILYAQSKEIARAIGESIIPPITKQELQSSIDKLIILQLQTHQKMGEIIEELRNAI
jgi:hypothetical protein